MKICPKCGKTFRNRWSFAGHMGYHSLIEKHGNPFTWEDVKQKIRQLKPWEKRRSYKGAGNPMFGKKRPEVSLKNSIFKYGKIRKETHGQKYKIISTLDWNTPRGREIHDKEVTKVAKRLKAEGFKIIRFCEGDPRPDIIAIKGNKVYAYEVEFNNPCFEKYVNCTQFDDIVWLIYRPLPKYMRDEKK